jgi:hypothetical protein
MLQPFWPRTTGNPLVIAYTIILAVARASPTRNHGQRS